MTPAGWLTDDIVGWAALWIFLGPLPIAALATLVGRWKGVAVGIGSALLLWGVGNLVVVGVTALAVYVDSTVLSLPLARCEPGVDHRQRAERRLVFALQRPGQEPREVALLKTLGRCPDQPVGPVAVRVRQDRLATAAPVIDGEEADSDKPLVVMVIWGAMGAFAVLGATLLLRSLRPYRSRPASASSAPSEPTLPAAWRVSIGHLLSQLGLLLFLAAFIAPWFLDGSTERALQMGMRCVASAMGCWLLAGLVAGTMNIGAAIVLLSFGGALLGFAEVVRVGE